ncbi:P27 family phage terminase small subunit [Plesiomonas shigelloides]|uniref:P27 family phage terminase small subunit n=1 Tax=Plesiomonas shigelloides TaxID=703 RepID=UPI00387F0C75
MTESKFTTNILLSDDEANMFRRIKNMLSEERELKPSDMDSIAMLVLAYSMLHAAQREIDANGYMVVSHTQYGQVTKKSPALDMMKEAQLQIRSLHDALLMNPKAKAIADKSVSVKTEEDDADDPISRVLKKRASK